MPHDDRGTAVVEFAVVLPLVLIVLLGVVEVALAARAQLEVSQAAREGARAAATTPEPERAVDAVRAALGARLAAGAHVSVVRDQRVGGRAEVTVRVPYRLAAPVFGGVMVHLQARSVTRVER